MRQFRLSSLKTLLLSSAMVFGAQSAVANDVLSVATTPVPAGEILEFMTKQLAEQGVELRIHNFTDYIQPNQQVAEGHIDMNCFQHKPHMDSFNESRGANLVAQGVMYLPPMAGYSNKVKDLDELKRGATIAIPSDTTNGGRALFLLHRAGVITLKDPDNIFATSRDISDNPKRIKFIELEAATIPRVLSDVDLAVITANYALDAGLNPLEDSLFIEASDSHYVNICASREDNKDREAIQKLNAAWQSPETLRFIEETYKGTVIPAKSH